LLLNLFACPHYWSLHFGSLLTLSLTCVGNPYNDPNCQKSNAYKTLFVSNLSYKTEEKSLREAFEPFGRIRRVRIVVNQKTGKPRGYAFIEYESESDLQCKRSLCLFNV
jgi:RNA recognition motif. (a.k.a. RRM, RBD, or RNP domain)